jgi:hypothetical protein
MYNNSVDIIPLRLFHWYYNVSVDMIPVFILTDFNRRSMRAILNSCLFK